MAAVMFVGKKIDDFVQTFAGLIGYTPPNVCVNVPTFA
jgi:hypothetical protein